MKRCTSILLLSFLPLFFALCMWAPPALAQVDPAATNAYLLVWFERNYDNVSRRSFVTIKAESGCDSAFRIYALMNYEPKNWTPEDNSRFFHLNKKSDSLYNYFLTPTEGLNYLSAQGWQIVSVVPQIASGSDNERVVSSGYLVPVATVSSYPLFCLRKQTANR